MSLMGRMRPMGGMKWRNAGRMNYRIGNCIYVAWVYVDCAVFLSNTLGPV
jgi:hypothetical protein